VSPAVRPISSLSALVSPPGGGLMGAVKGYFDESGDDGAPHNALAFCGYVCTHDGWEAFENEWRKALAENEAPYLHMKELQNPTGRLARFAGNENQERCKTLLMDLVSVIEKSKLVGVGSLIRLPDLREFNAKNELNLAPLPLVIYATMLELYRLHPDDTLELVVDRLDKPELTIAIAVEYASSHWSQDVSEVMSWLPLKGDNSFRNVLPIQAADFAAWEARKDHERKNEWWKNNKRGLDSDEWVSNETAWLQSQGKTWPDHRKSFSAILRAAKINAGVLDYDALCKIHEARRSVWSSESPTA
jgi:hypothetical protein